MKKLSFLLSVLFFGMIFLSSCGDTELKLDKKTYAPEETIKITFTADPNWDDNAWIGIIPSDVAHGKESVNDENDIYYEYINKKTSGTFEFSAPSEPGKYDIRMHDSDDGSKGVEIASVSFEVK